MGWSRMILHQHLRRTARRERDLELELDQRELDLLDQRERELRDHPRTKVCLRNQV